MIITVTNYRYTVTVCLCSTALTASASSTVVAVVFFLLFVNFPFSFVCYSLQSLYPLTDTESNTAMTLSLLVVHGLYMHR